MQLQLRCQWSHRDSPRGVAYKVRVDGANITIRSTSLHVHCSRELPVPSDSLQPMLLQLLLNHTRRTWSCFA